MRTEKVEPQPLYVEPRRSSFWPITDNGHLVVKHNEEIEFLCPGHFKYPFEDDKTVIAKCVDGRTFSVDGKHHDFTAFACKTWPSYTARRTGRSCPGGELLESGFSYEDRFFRLTEICFNPTEEATRYVYHTLEPGSDYYQQGMARVEFITDGFFGGKDVNYLYTQKKQKETISHILGFDAGKYFDERTSYFLARGHLAAKADFIMGAEQRGTFLFVNTAPQWQRFNAGNWQRVEDSTRTMATKRKLNLECYTGTYGVTTLANKHGKQTEIYLYDEGGHKQIPVPKLYFRVVIEPRERKGIVLIGVNNPHLTLEEIERDYIVCPDISSRINWVNWSKHDISKGYSYACEVNEFRKHVRDLPEFDVRDLLI